MEKEEDLMKRLLKEKEDFELGKLAWQAIQIEKSEEIQKKLNNFLKNENNFNILDSNNINKINYKIEEEQKYNDLKFQINNLKNEYNIKLSKYNTLKNNLAKEKKNFEIDLNKKKKELIVKQNAIEQQKNDIYMKEKEYERRMNDLRKKEDTLEEKIENYEKINNFVIEKNNKNLKDKIDLEKAEYKMNLLYNQLLQEEFYVGEEQNKIDKDINDLEQDKMKILNDKKEIEEIEKEIDLRIKCMGNLCEKKILQDFENTNYLMKKKVDGEEFKGLNGGLFKNENNFKNINQHNKLNGNYNDTDLYLLQLNNTFNTITKKFDPIKEQKYLAKTYETLKKIKK